MNWTQLEAVEKVLTYAGHRTLRVASFLYYFRVGKEHGFPICCVIQYAWDVCRKKPPAVRRGTIMQPGKETYVPCWYHKRDPFWEAFTDTQPIVQLRLFEETQDEAQDREWRRRKLERRYSGRGFGRPYRQSR